MKIAEALQKKADYQASIESLKERIENNVRVEKGASPYEKPKDLLDSLFYIRDKLTELTIKIHDKNYNTILPSGERLSNLIAKRKAARTTKYTLDSIMNRVINRGYRQPTDTEISIDVPALRREIDTAAKEYRELNTLIQEINWTTDFE